MAFDISANRGSSVIACAIIFMVLSTLMVGFRFLSHRVMRRPIFLDDWLMIPAWIMMLGLGANLIVSMLILPPNDQATFPVVKKPVSQ